MGPRWTHTLKKGVLKYLSEVVILVVGAVTLGEHNFLTRNLFLLNPVNLKPQSSIFLGSKLTFAILAIICSVWTKIPKFVLKSRCGSLTVCLGTHSGAQKCTFNELGWELGPERLNMA